MEQTWRWWGPNDLITLPHICQTGATGIVTALHDVPTRQPWSAEAIQVRKRAIEADPALGLRWSVVESVPVHESIKLGEDGAEGCLEAYRQTLAKLGAAGVRTVCYNFMPVLDWARTQLRAPLPGGATALRFNYWACRASAPPPRTSPSSWTRWTARPTASRSAPGRSARTQRTTRPPLLDDVGKPTHPGYPAIGRLRGLAELRGVMLALSHQHGLPL